MKVKGPPVPSLMYFILFLCSSWPINVIRVNINVHSASLQLCGRIKWNSHACIDCSVLKPPLLLTTTVNYSIA